MRSKFLNSSFSLLMVASLCWVGCVNNPPNRKSGTTPPPEGSPGGGGNGGGGNGGGGNGGGGNGGGGNGGGGNGGGGNGGGGNGGGGNGGGGNAEGRSVMQPAPVEVKVSYWLNKTANDNCLTIQPAGTEVITSKCVSEGASTATWVSKSFSAPDNPLKVLLKVDTKEKASEKSFSSQSDNLGDQSWRWRCVKAKDKATQKTITTVCYEDGNALNKKFESSDVFVQFIGPEKIDLGAITCVAGDNIETTTCLPN